MRPLAPLAAVVLTLAVAGWAGFEQSRAYQPDTEEIPAQGRVGEPIRLGSTTAQATVVSVQSATSFPNRTDPKRPATVMPHAHVVVVTLQLDHGSEDPSQAHCDVSLIQREPVKRHWTTDSDEVVRRSFPGANTSCTKATSTTMLTAFTIPSDALDHISVRLRYSRQTTVEVPTR